MMETMEQRRDAITKFVDDWGTVSFAQLKHAFPQVSEMTLRTDLKNLDEAHRILRVHGGAKSVQVAVGTDDFLNRKAIRCIQEKQTIATKALSLLRPDTVLYLDSGSTMTMFARKIPNQSYLIYTTGLSCATELANLSMPTVMLPGGRMNRYSQSVCGIEAIKGIERVSFDQAFIGVSGYHTQNGFSCGTGDEAYLKRSIIHQSEQVIVLMDSTKIDVRYSFQIADLSEIDIIVSDGCLPEEFVRKCQLEGVEIL